MLVEIVFGVLLLVLIFFLVRTIYLIYSVFTNDIILYRTKSIRTLTCTGSGGHTTEILRFMKNLPPEKYKPRLYVAADSDVGSEVKIKYLEEFYGNKKYEIQRIPRSRNVNQSYLSSFGSTLYATMCTIPIVYNFQPDLILCNGPGTCIPICLIAFIMRCFFLLDCRIVFIESICRVTTLSLTGKILQLFADVFVVQWPQLRDSCLRAKYFGRLT